ncbi:LysR family transcriptional regulator [Williamsia sp. CHRR-6]|uniref:LysR family transcriptional regulator n=1 Tax=Williamsia sp. CHRR-6 TaxID=2835871 RepID=UPI001BDAB753|nr:LysR family transcriptional regulator [Williamsia sp. CHRR-6]MBT0568326.1 LysR family transcriptional regulator [Williamsia sp. CHRR-6]
MVLSSRMPDLNALEVLLAVAAHGSLTAAARHLNLTQQAVSARIRSMEALTGVQMVIRTSHGSTLTPAGHVVAGWADGLLDTAHRIDSGLASLRTDARAHLRIAASLTIAEQLLPHWLMSHRAQAHRHQVEPPKVTVVASNSAQAIAAVRDGDADLGFVESPGTPKAVRSRIVDHDELVVVVARAHPWAKRTVPVTAEELSATSLVTRESGSGTREFLSDAIRSALGPSHPQAAPAMEMPTTSGVRSAVLANAGPAVLSRLSVVDDLTLGRLVAVPHDGIVLRRDLRAVWMGGRIPPAGAIRDLVGHVAALRN